MSITKKKIHMEYYGLLFVTGSIIGWCIEVIYRSVYNGQLTIPGFLVGPYCPIYGFGVLIILLLCDRNNIFIAFGEIFLLSSVLEYLVSALFESAFHTLLWNYSMLPLSIGTRINFIFSIMWGLVGLFELKFAEPKLRKMFITHTKKAKYIVRGGLLLIFMDTVISVATKFLRF